MKSYKRNVIIVLIIFFIVLIGYFEYNDWHNKEYPSGELEQATNKINIFYGGWYCDELFISFSDVFQIHETNIISDLDMEKIEEMIRFMLDYCNLNYNVTYKEWCDDKKEVEFNLNETVLFNVKYHTYDRLLFGNDAVYVKTKVFEQVYIKYHSGMDEIINL